MPDPRRVGSVVVTVDGGPLPADLYADLTDVRVEQSVHLPDKFSLHFRDPEFELLDRGLFAIGKTLDLSFDNGSGEVVVTNGEVTAIAVDQGAGDRHELIVSGLDRAHRLARSPRVRTFLQVSDSDVARTIASEYGLRAVTDTATVRHVYLLQAQTDYAFLTERAQASGFSWWVDDSTLYFKNRPVDGRGPKLTFGENLMRFKLRCSASEAAKQVQVRAWDAETQRAIVGTAQTGTPGANGVDLVTQAPIGDTQLKAAAGSFAGSVVRATSRVGVANAAEADALARAIGQQATSEQVAAKGEVVGEPSLRAGNEVEIGGVGEQLSGTYLLTSVEHVIGTSRGYITRFSCAGRRPGGLVDLLGPAPADPWVAGALVVGVVTNTKDPERLGRVKVKYPTLSDKDESWWARVASVGAGPGRGLQAGFEVGDEVLVGFEHNDLRRPIVVGGLWSIKHRPPRDSDAVDPSTGLVVSQMWRSHAGHVVELHDSTIPAQSYVSITLRDGKTKLHMGEDGVTIEAPRAVSITSDEGISLTAKGDITLDGANVTINAKAKVAVEGAQVAVKGKAQLQMEAAQSTLKGTGMVSVEAGGVAAVKGALLKLN